VESFITIGMTNGLLGLTRTDGLLHIETSAIICTVLTAVLPWWGASAITLAIGVGKELWDKYHDGAATWHDIICDVIGILLGLALTLIHIV